MSGSLLSLVMNGIIIVLLGATIVYAQKLSTHIRVFRDSRKDLDKLIRDLGQQIEKADATVSAMKAAARDSGKDLQRRIDEARGLSEELQLVAESANNLASRLEKGAERPKPSVRAVKQPEPARREKGRETPVPAFAIRDPEFGRDEEEQGMDETAMQSGRLQSRAERELYEALLKRRKGDAGAMS